MRINDIAIISTKIIHSARGICACVYLVIIMIITCLHCTGGGRLVGAGIPLLGVEGGGSVI